MWKCVFCWLQRFHFLQHCSFVASVNLQSCLRFFNFYRILLLETCARFLSFLPCIFIVIASFYRFSLVLSFQSRFISICVLIFSPFLFHLESFVRGVVANCPLIDFTSQNRRIGGYVELQWKLSIHTHLNMQIRQKKDMFTRS